MSKVSAKLYIILILSLAGQPAQAGLLKLVGGAMVGVAVVACAPAVLGFGAAGIASGSMAASMMSASAIASGGGVGAGGVVATLQSLGAVGLTAKTAMIGASMGAATGHFFDDDDCH